MSDGEQRRTRVFSQGDFADYLQSGQPPEDVEPDEPDLETEMVPPKKPAPSLDELRDALNERQEMTDALIARMQQTLAAPRWAVFMMRWEDGKLPLEHAVFNWSDDDYPAIVNSVRKRVQEIQTENLARRRADGKEPLRGHMRSRTILRNPEA
jgi:hypothetical protein